MGAGAIYPSPRAGQYTIGEMETRVISPPHEQVDKQLWRWKHAPYPLPTGRSINNWGDGSRRHIPSPRAGQYTIGEMGAGAIYPSHELVNIQLWRWEQAPYIPPHEQVNIQLGRWEQAPYIPPTSWSIYNWDDGSRRHISLPRRWSIYNWGDGSRRHISLPRAGQYSIGEMGTRAIYPSHELVNIQLGRWEQAPYIPPTRWSIFNWGDVNRGHISLPTRWSIFNLGRWEQAPYVPPHALVNKQLERWEQAPYIPPHELVNIQLGRWKHAPYIPPHGQVDKQLGRWKHAPYPLPTSWSIYNWGDGSRRHISLP